MTVRRDEPPIPEKVIFTLVAPDGRRLTASTRPIADGSELCWSLDGAFSSSRLYRGEELAQLKPDLDARSAELEADGWTLEG